MLVEDHRRDDRLCALRSLVTTFNPVLHNGRLGFLAFATHAAR
jgi:hypothetical protein